MSFSAVGYHGPSFKQFVTEYLPLMLKMVTFDGKRLLCRPGVSIVSAGGFTIDNQESFNKIQPVVFDYKAPTVNYPGDKEAKQEIIGAVLSFSHTNTLTSDFNFNKLPHITQPIKDDITRIIILCQQVLRKFKLLYIGFESGGGFYPMKPIQLPSSFDQDGSFTYAKDISRGMGLLIPSQPHYRYETKDGIYHSEDEEGKHIIVYRANAKLASITLHDNNTFAKLYCNGQIETCMANITTHSQIISYTEGKRSLYRCFDRQGMLQSHIEYRGSVTHGKLCKIDPSSIVEATNDNGYLSGPFTVVYNNHTTVKGCFRRDARMTDEVPDYHENVIGQELIGEFIFDRPAKYQHFNFDADGLRSGVQIERVYINQTPLICKVPLSDHKASSDNIVTTKRYFLHGTEYSSTIYYAILNKVRQAIASPTQLLTELINIVMAYN